MGYSDTDDLIRMLADDAGQARRPLPLRAALGLAVAGGVALAGILAFTLFGAGDGLGRTLGNGWFYHKLASMAAMAAGAALVLTDLAQPGRNRVRGLALLPALALMGIGAVADASGLSLGGRLTYSVPNCVGAIVLLALPGLGLIMLATRRYAAATHPMLAGAVAGLLAGALGGAAYALACRNDGGQFVALWYGTAMALVAGFGSLLGRRFLRW